MRRRIPQHCLISELPNGSRLERLFLLCRDIEETDTELGDLCVSPVFRWHPFAETNQTKFVVVVPFVVLLTWYSVSCTLLAQRGEVILILLDLNHMPRFRGSVFVELSRFCSRGPQITESSIVQQSPARTSKK